MNSTCILPVHTMYQNTFYLSDIEEILPAESFSNITDATFTSSSPQTTEAVTNDEVHVSKQISLLFIDAYFSTVNNTRLPSSPSTSIPSETTSVFILSLSTIYIMSNTNTDSIRDLLRHLPQDTPKVPCNSSNLPIRSTPQ